MRHRWLIAALLVCLPLAAHAGSVPVQIVRFVGTPADSSDRVTQAFEAAFSEAQIPCERLENGAWVKAEPKANPFVRVDAAGSELTWQLDLSLRFPPEVRVPVPRRHRRDPVRSRQSTLRTSRGFVFAVTAVSPTNIRRDVTPEGQRFEVYFADLKTQVVPSTRLPSGAYDFPYDDAARVVARAAIEVMLRANEQLAKDERAALNPATRIQP
ncbi:MAG: hypothetical protein K8R56_08435 [Candidatus Eisenbacteria bacterium]|nr:hypothetical protein [Candidatus Eisenbacteria bacterium]